MKLKELKHHWETIRDELNQLPSDIFISDKPRPEGEWEGSEILTDIIEKYTQGGDGWLKGGQDHVENEWISWPLIWSGNPVVGNCLKCPETFKLLHQIKGIQVAGFSLMKGGVKLKEHTDNVDEGYKCTYHLGLKCPKGCILHHSVIGDVMEEDGKHIVMNAKFKHWAENVSSEDRVILYIEMYLTTP